MQAEQDVRAKALLSLDARRRLSLASLNPRHDHYLATVEPDGTIVLVPAVVMTQTEADLARSGPVVDAIDRFLSDPSTGVGRRRPKRAPGDA